MKLLGLLHNILKHRINNEVAHYTDMLFFRLGGVKAHTVRGSCAVRGVLMDTENDGLP